jgi:hypothetical protein
VAGGESQKFLDRKVSKVHDSSFTQAPSMPFSCFFVMESLVPSHLAPLSGSFSLHCICYSGALRYAHPRVPIGQDGADVLRLVKLLINDIVLIDSSGRVMGRNIFLTKTTLRSVRLYLQHSILSMTSPCSDVIGLARGQRQLRLTLLVKGVSGVHVSCGQTVISVLLRCYM